MKPQHYRNRFREVNGWLLRLNSYKLGEIFYCTADNVSPGACLARTTGVTREEAEDKAVARAGRLLSRTRRNPIA